MYSLTISFCAITLLWLVYWVMIRPIILDSVREEYRRLRTQLDWAIIEGLPNAESLPAKELEKAFARSDSVRWVSLSPAFFMSISRRQETKALEVKEREIFESSPKWIRDMRERDLELTIKAALANSPLWWFPLSAILVVAVFSKEVSNRWAEMKIAANEIRVEGLPASA
jgi:hypothetical protein